jgi:hypothetical protein
MAIKHETADFKGRKSQTYKKTRKKNNRKSERKPQKISRNK